MGQGPTVSVVPRFACIIRGPCADRSPNKFTLELQSILEPEGLRVLPFESKRKGCKAQEPNVRFIIQLCIPCEPFNAKRRSQDYSLSSEFHLLRNWREHWQSSSLRKCNVCRQPSSRLIVKIRCTTISDHLSRRTPSNIITDTTRL